jgi:lauroyl/myristoyl acyltransferase
MKTQNIRRFITARLTGTAQALAPRLSPGVIDVLERGVARAGPFVPGLGRMVADNLRAMGMYSPQTHRDYFAYAAAHLAGVLRVFRYADREGATAGRMHPELDRFVRERILLDDTFDRLREAAAPGRGVVLLGVHASNYMLVLARINQELPITVYLRHSRDPRKQEAKRAWCRATGLDFIAEPPDILNPARRAEVMADALRQGRILIITPDLAQKREDGVPVRWLDREVYLPGGPAALSLLVEAPLVTVLARPAGDGAIRLVFYGPVSPCVTQRRKGWRQEATRERLQWFADLMADEFLRPCPALWFLWGDKRWTRVFRGDSRYTRRLQELRTEN